MNDAIVILNDANFEEKILKTNMPALVDLWAPWCAPCRMIAPTIEELATEYQKTAIIGKLNVDENPVVARKYGVTSIPTLLFFKGGEVADHMIGIPAGNAKKIIEDKLKGIM